MFDRFKEFIGIDDNYDDYDDEQLYYDDDNKEENNKESKRETYSNLFDDDKHGDVEDTNQSTTYESSYNFKRNNSYTNDSYNGGLDYPSTYSNNYQRSSRRGDNVVSMTENNFTNRSSMRISIQEPLDYEQDAPKVVDDILEKKVVVLNLEMLDMDMRRQIFDFVSGAVYALEGKVEKVTKGIFVITPKGIDIDSSVTAQISEGNYNQL